MTPTMLTMKRVNRMKLRRIPRLLGLLAACVVAPAVVCGCGDALKAPYPAKAYFLLAAGNPGPDSGDRAPATAAAATGATGATGAAAAERVLKVRQFRVTPPYDGGSFVYKVGPDQYSTDYYTAFLMPTDRMLGEEVRNWLDRSGPFDRVIDAGSGARARFSLEGNVTAFYGDFTNRAAPRAVIEARFLLLSDDNAGPRILFTRSYSASAPVTGPGPAGLVDGWNRACRQMLEELTADLGRCLSQR